MATLSFNVADVRRVVNHAYAAKEWSRPFGVNTAPRPQLIFVHDDGLYLMSNGQPRDIVSGERSFCAYARGYDPKAPGVWDKARDAVGGDDFAEYLTLTDEMVELIQGDRFDSFKLKVTASSIQILVGEKRDKPAAAPEPQWLGDLLKLPNGPKKKFYLLKWYGAEMARKSGLSLIELGKHGCDDLVKFLRAEG